MDSSKIKTILVSALAAFAALYLGIAAATAQVEAVLWIVGAGGVTVCFILGRRIWLLLPFMTSLALTLPVQGNFSTGLIGQLLVLGFCGLLFLMRKLPMQGRFTELEFWNLLFLLCVVQVYIRNPVGLNLFGGENIGGKPYVMFAITVASAFLISILRVPPHELKWYVRAVMLGSWINFSLGAIGKLVPGIGMFLGASFANDVEQSQDLSDRSAIDEGAANRVGFVRSISTNLANWVSSRISPLKACFMPLWAPLVGFSLLAAAVSGFRSQFAAVGLTFLIGIFYRGGFRHLFLASVLGVSVLSVLGLVNLVNPLPPNIQRSLTFLPGTWDQRYKKDTAQSTEWRMQMWIDALSSNRYIKNHILGDGLGMTAEQWRRAHSSATSVGNVDAHRESAMQSGDYHSGPVQTIRTVGYVGLVVLLVGLLRLAVHTHRQIERCRDTEWFPVALFIGNIYIWYAFSWTFIIGTFLSGATVLLMGGAMIRLLQNNLPLPAYVVKRREPYILKSHRQRLAEAEPPARLMSQGGAISDRPCP
jgi:hypothetical protein